MQSGHLIPQILEGARSGAKKRPPFERGPSCLGSLAVRELDGGRPAWVPLARIIPRGEGDAGLSAISAPVKAAASWGDTATWAAKLFFSLVPVASLLRGLVTVSSPLQLESDGREKFLERCYQLTLSKASAMPNLMPVGSFPVNH
jgi:hypothetical protein